MAYTLKTDLYNVMFLLENLVAYTLKTMSNPLFIYLFIFVFAIGIVTVMS